MALASVPVPVPASVPVPAPAPLLTLPPHSEAATAGRPAAPASPAPALPNLPRVRVLEGSAELLLGQLRLHAKRVRALAASYRREVARLSTDSGADLLRIDQGLDEIAARITAALTAVDTAFAFTFAGVAALDHLAAATDIEHPDHTPAQRLAARAAEISTRLRSQHDAAHAALRAVAEGLVVNANSLAIVAGRPGPRSVDQLRVITRQMRALSSVTADLNSRLGVFVQNQSAALQPLIAGGGSKDVAPRTLPRAAVEERPIPSLSNGPALSPLEGGA